MALTRRNPAVSDRAASLNTTDTHHNADTGDSSRYRRQAVAWRRRPWMECGCTEPCRCYLRNNPTPNRIDGYRDALDHLARHGLLGGAFTPELRALWRRGGADRALAEAVTGRWSA